MNWEIEFTDKFNAWWNDLGEADQESIAEGIIILGEDGPALGRPWVDTVRGSRHANMKELRPRRGNLRVLFAFDPRRMAILLIGGDKTGRWHEWYGETIPVADDLYDTHLRELREEGMIR